MGRVYSIPLNFTHTAAGGDTDIVSIQPADDKPCRLIGFEPGQVSETGDAAEEMVDFELIHMTATVTIGSGGNSVTPVPARPGTDLAAGFTARVNDTTVATTSGTSTPWGNIGWNERNTPYEKFIEDRFQKRAVQGEVLIIRAKNTLADDMSFRGTAWIEEDG